MLELELIKMWKLMGDLEDCTISVYGKILIRMLKCANLHILNDTNAFFMTNVLTCLPTSRGGSVL